MAMHVPTRTAMREPYRLQFDISDTGSDIQPGLALHADGLQRIGILRPADQKVAAAADSDRCVGADAPVIASEIAASNPGGGCVHRPGKPGLIGEADIQAVAADGCDVGLRTPAFTLEHTFKAGPRARDTANILAA